jgi:hypothetical protein
LLRYFSLIIIKEKYKMTRTSTAAVIHIDALRLELSSMFFYIRKTYEKMIGNRDSIKNVLTLKKRLRSVHLYCKTTRERLEHLKTYRLAVLDEFWETRILPLIHKCEEQLHEVENALRHHEWYIHNEAVEEGQSLAMQSLHETPPSEIRFGAMWNHAPIADTLEESNDSVFEKNV